MVWISGGASDSADDDGGDGGGPQDWQRFQQPDNEVPAVVPLHLVLARTPDLAVVVADGVQVHRRGFAFGLTVLARRDPGPRHDLFQQIAGHGPGAERLLLGIEFADGRRVSNTSGMPPRLGSATDGVSLVSQGGGGGGRRYRQDFWVTALPPAGPLRFVVRWDAQQVDETVVETDGGRIATAAQFAEELWPYEPEDPAAYEPELPVLPTEGWFARGL